MKPILFLAILFVTVSSFAQQKMNKPLFKASQNHDTLSVHNPKTTDTTKQLNKVDYKKLTLFTAPIQDNMPIAKSDSTTNYHMKMVQKDSSIISL